MKTKLFCKFFITMVLATVLLSCNKDENIVERNLPPVITFDSETSVYTVKLGRTLLLEPTVENDANATYEWLLNGKTVGTGRSYTFVAEKMSADDIFVKLIVKTALGVAECEVRIDVTDLDRPLIGLVVPPQGYVMELNSELTLDPAIDCNLKTTYSWSVDAVEKSTDKIFKFRPTQKRTYKISLKSSNADGSDNIEFDVRVCSADELPFKWIFDQTVFNISQGRTIRLMPLDLENAAAATYKWEVDGQQRQNGPNPAFDFEGTAVGSYTITVTATDNNNAISQTLTVNVAEQEGRYKRPLTSGCSAGWNKIYEFMPAPGQFTNDGYTCTTMDQAVAYAKKNLTEDSFVSLGGFGGYIVVGFDHSIENNGGYNLQIKSNYGASGMSEAAVVWVMQDENGNGTPDDTWYELRGSEYGKAETIHDYAVTYFRPRKAASPTPWRDNQGKTGTVARNGYHTQDYYYPLWVSAATYTLRGVKLKSNATESRPGFWEVPAFEWGYVDNPSSIDALKEPGSVNHFRISDAVRFDGKEANLEYIDFVKVQNAVNASIGILGEVSTEVVGFKDYNMATKQ